MIKWYVKYLLSTLMELAPFTYKLHKFAQHILKSDTLNEEEMLSRSIELMSLVIAHKGRLQDQKILELGTGWFPYISVVAYLLGAKKVITVDLNPWLNVQNLKTVISSVIEHNNEITSKLNIKNQIIYERLERLKEILTSNDGLQEILDNLGIKYMPQFDVRELELNDEDKIDICLSSNVLEHIEQDILEEIFTHIKEIADDGGLLINRFNPADHYGYLSGSTITFLTVGDKLWSNFLGGRGVAYQNRLRSSEFVEIFNTTGWSVKFRANAVDNDALKSVENGSIKLAAPYSKMQLEDVCTYYCWFVCNLKDEISNAPVINVKWIDDVVN